MAGRVKLGAQGLAVAVVAGLLVLLIWKVTHQPQAARGTAPDFTLPRLDRSGELRLASLRGKAVVLNFWASWCIPCKEEARVLEAAWRRWRSRDVVVVGIDSQDFTGDARRFARRYGMTYPLVHDGAGKTRTAYGVPAYPETFVVSRRGRIIGHIAGQIAESDIPVLERHIVDALRA